MTWEEIMEFHEKLQQLRKQKGLTQEALAEKLYVSRAAVSKWESGKGYPNIESLKTIAAFYSVTLDELLSSGEVLTIAEAHQKQTQSRYRDMVFGLLDLCMVLLFFLPLFAVKSGDSIRAVSLLSFMDAPIYLNIAYHSVVIGMTVLGILLLALQNCTAAAWINSKRNLSFVCGVLAVLLFVISSQPYAAVFSFFLLAVKVILQMKRD